MWQTGTNGNGSEWLQSKHIFVGESRIATKSNKEIAGKTEGNLSFETEHQYWYHSDHLGSAQLTTTRSGELHERIEYTPYGEIWVEHRYDPAEGSLPYRFTGKELDEETGYYYYGARYLDPRTSRWISTDPAVGDYVPQAEQGSNGLPGMGGVFNLVNMHVYHYAGNNPVKYTDPNGNEVIISGDEINQTKILEYINIMSDQQYIVVDGKLQKDSDKRFEYGSEQYSDAINYLIENGTTTIQIADTYTDENRKEIPLPLDYTGKTQLGYTYGNNDLKKMNVSIRGISGIFELSDGSYGTRGVAEILMHELAGHAAPRISGIIGNAIEIENSIMTEIASRLPFATWMSNHWRGRAYDVYHSTHHARRLAQ
jgi:RHS repeat-associated protein